MLVSLWLLLPIISCLANNDEYVTPGSSPIMYGGVLSASWTPLLANSSDLQETMKCALERRKNNPNSNIPIFEDGSVIEPYILKASKTVLRYTDDSTTSKYIEIILEELNDGRLVTQKRAVIMGVLYSILLMWPKAGVIHHFLVTRDKKREYSLYAHTHFDADTSLMLSNCMKDHSCGDIGNLENKWISPSHWRAPDFSFTRDSSSVLDACPNSDLSIKSGKCPSFQNGGSHKNARMSVDAGKDWSQNERSGVSLSKQLKIATYNVWNFNGYDEGNYKLRMEQLGKLCEQNNAEIFGFQEVRYDINKRVHWGPNQVEHLSTLFPQYQFVFQPAMSYPEKIFDRVEEGVAIFSWYPIVNHSYILLSRDVSDEGDTHQRICLHAEIETPQLQKVHVFNTHLPLSEAARNRNVLEIWSFIQTHPKPWILMGDLNAEPHSKAMRFLAGLETMGDVTTKGFQDVWTALYREPRPGAPGVYAEDQAPDPGLTFSTLESKLVKRVTDIPVNPSCVVLLPNDTTGVQIDYLFVALDGRAKIESVDLIDDGVRWDDVTSDHLGVSVTLNPLKSDHESGT